MVEAPDLLEHKTETSDIVIPDANLFIAELAPGDGFQMLLWIAVAAPKEANDQDPVPNPPSDKFLAQAIPETVTPAEAAAFCIAVVFDSDAEIAAYKALVPLGVGETVKFEL